MDGATWKRLAQRKSEFGSMEANRRGCSPHHNVSKFRPIARFRLGLLGLFVLLGHIGAATLWGQATVADRVYKPSTEANSEAWIANELTRYQNLGQFQGNVYVTRNFVIRAANANLAQAVGDRAEGYRELLAIQWLGQPLPPWPQPCPILVTVSNQAHGETSFLLPENGYGLPSDWDMKVFGPADRILDSVLPHEITHTLFATHFKQRLPRWADEGACTTIEHASERDKIQALLLRFLSPQQQQGIPFNRMFAMREYPADMLPLYAQGYSVAKFLIGQGGHKQFVQLIERGLQNERSQPVTVAWDQAMREIYGYQDLSELQLDWLQWVAAGSREEDALARRQQRVNPLATAAAIADSRVMPADFTTDMAGSPSGVPLAAGPVVAGSPAATASFVDNNVSGSENFYVQQMRAGLSSDATDPPPARSAAPPSGSVAPPPSASLAPPASKSAPLPLLSPSPLADSQVVGSRIAPSTPTSAEATTTLAPNYRSDSTILVPSRLR